MRVKESTRERKRNGDTKEGNDVVNCVYVEVKRVVDTDSDRAKKGELGEIKLCRRQID